MSSYESGARRFDKVVRFLTIAPVKAGWLVKSDGIWFITDEGKQALARFADPSEFRTQAARLYRVWKNARDASADSEPSVDVDDDIEVDGARTVTFEQAEEQAWSEIDRYLSTMDPFDLQRLVADLLQGMGYHVAWISPPGKDHGIDIIAFTDPLGSQGPRIKVQVKRLTSSRVDADGLRAFLATISGTDVGIFVALSGFTKDAEDYARNQENRRMTLINAKRLVELWVEHYAKLTDKARQLLPLTPIYFLAPDV
ncbi:MAG: restriction endonuclease [Hyphomonadaceae bacterium]|nr:restriction endonuclease [Hyphomonadaceae bacterium]